MKRFSVLILTLLFISVSFADGSEKKHLSREEMFFKANEAYKEGRFEDAIGGYTRLLNGGYKSGHLFYNLGNTYFRLNQLGYAVLNYERARLLIPRNGDLGFNLRYARDQTRDALPVYKDLISTTFFWMDSLNFNELFWGLSVLNVLFFMTLMVRLFDEGEWTYYVFIVV
ncbi:MAG: hypothetical protein JRF40_13100, partial [Deltaproteobacteria bacterium]|nr:hypothetical protein [Deltaproteobacteria bacterium]